MKVFKLMVSVLAIAGMAATLPVHAAATTITQAYVWEPVLGTGPIDSAPNNTAPGSNDCSGKQPALGGVCVDILPTSGWTQLVGFSVSDDRNASVVSDWIIQDATGTLLKSGHTCTGSATLNLVLPFGARQLYVTPGATPTWALNCKRAGSGTATTGTVTINLI